MEDEVLLECPQCGEEEQQVLKASEASWVLRCTDCGAVRTVPAPPKARLRQVPAIVSAGNTSSTQDLQVPLDGPVAVGDELEVEGHRLLITALERPDGTRPLSALGRDVKVLYAKVFDTVLLHYTVNQGEVTRSFREEVPPEEEVHVGTVREVDGVRLAVKTLKSDQNRTLHRGFLLARNIRRVFADVATGRPGSRVRTRARGKDKPVRRRA